MLPLQEKERVRRTLLEAQPDLYGRINTDLAESIQTAHGAKLNYLKFAFYEDPRTGAPNEPHNMLRLLTQADRAERGTPSSPAMRKPDSY